MENKTGVELIAEERQRQIDVESYDVINDAGYSGGELVVAATCYAVNYLNKSHGYPLFRAQGKVPKSDDFEDAWPWGEEYDKREKHDAERSLVIAGALIAAELDRLQSLKV